MRPANSELVAVAFLKLIPNVGTGVATQLPEDVSSWPNAAFVKVGPVVGGGNDMYVPQNAPVVQVECYAANVDTKFPPWDKASDLAKYIEEGTYNSSLLGVRLTLRTGYRQAYVQSAFMVGSFQRAEDDPSSYAVMRGDLALTWIEVPE